MFGMRLGLEATRRVLAAFGEPQRELSVVLVAGTNGKGSTAALVASMAGAAGYRVGLYTSPHLEHPRERLRLGGEAIAGGELERLTDEVIARGETLLGHPPSYFETLTVAAIVHFAAQAVDLAVLEVGLGGRLDATNVVEPRLSLITEIGLDHQQYLGSSLEAIANEKAGILRPGVPALAWVSEPAARRALGERAEALGCPLELADRQVEITGREQLAWRGQRVRLRTPSARYALELALPGAHQARNLGLAVRAAETLSELGWERLDRGAIEAGAAACRWPGRLEAVELPPLAAGPRRVVLEAAHNAAACRGLLAFLDETGEPFDLLFGALADKQPETFLPALAERCRRLVLTRPASDRAEDPARLARALPEGRRARAIDDASQALDVALRDAEAPNLLVAGSIYLCGRVRELLRERFGVPAAAAETRIGADGQSSPISGG